jgi:NADPH:quinone reductase-like Zn-dependent oxidoreductase
MRVWQLDGGFGLDRLVRAKRDTPDPGPGQVLVKIHACSLNYRDYLTVIGDYNPRYRLPLIPVSDGAGEVVATGESVTGVHVGERVMGAFSQVWQGGEPSRERLRTSLGGPLDGMLADYALLDQHGVVPIPEHLSHEQASTLPCAALTAWSALSKYRAVRPGDTVLIQGTGGVAVFALQFARLLGATVIVTSSSDEKLERARALGADHAINYRTDPDWHRTARALTAKAGVDHIVEVGGAGTFEQSLAAVRIGGFVAVIGVLAGKAAPITLTPILMGSLTVQGITVGSRDDFLAMNRAIAAHRLEPVIDRVFGFDEAPAAFEHLAGGRHFGKVVIRLP